MKKPFSPAAAIDVHKKGFALIITLSVLVVVMALTGVLVGYMDTVRQDTVETKAILQANLYFKDIKNLITKFKNKKTLWSVLYAAPIPLQSEDGKFSIMIQCKPLTNGININWLGLGNNPVMVPQYNAAAKVFDRLADAYEIENPSRLEEMILASIGGQRQGYDEYQSRLRQKNGIISYQQFMRILARYQFETDDQKIGRIPWNKYFVFLPVEKNPKENRIDGDYLSAELISVFFDIDIESLKEEWVPGEGALKKILANNGVPYDPKLFSKGFREQARCEVGYDFKGERFAFSFVDSKGEVKDFEFYGKQ